jgi:hypothetical protein
MSSDVQVSGLIAGSTVMFFLFLSSSCRETAKKNAIKKSKEKTAGKKFSPSFFLQKVFDIDFPQKGFNGVFELPLLRNAQKRHKRRKKGTHLPHLPAIWQIYVAFNIFSSAPLASGVFLAYATQSDQPHLPTFSPSRHGRVC